MITLKKALSLSKEELVELKTNLIKEINLKKDLNAYIDIDELDANDATTHGQIPILIKDNICAKDRKVTCASKILQDYISPYDSSVVLNLKQNNMCAFGRANMDEFGMGSTTESSTYGPTKNPNSPHVVPGGSSGGCASAIASGIAIASLGSDTGGSIRQPASYCGCVGLKPSYGRVSRYGLVAYSSSLEQIGPITQNVEDCAILFDVIAKKCDKDSTCFSSNTSSLDMAKKLDPKRKLKICVLNNHIDGASTEVKNAYYDTIKLLESLGHEIIKKDMLDTTCHLSSYYIISTAEASANLARFDGIRYGKRANADSLKDVYYNTRALFGDEVKKRIMLGSFTLSSGYYEAYYLKAQKVRELIKKEYEEVFKQADAILSPIAPSVAPRFGSTKSSLEMYLSDIYTIGVNLAGLPAISLPVIKKPLPIGMQLIGPMLGEQIILDAAFGLELALDL